MPVSIFRIKDKSMLPTVGAGDYVLVSRITYSLRKPKVGELVVSRHPKRRMFIIKRISGISGSGYYLMGDNKDFSEDSRKFGPVDKKLFVGKVFAVVRKKRRPTTSLRTL